MTKESNNQLPRWSAEQPPIITKDLQGDDDGSIVVTKTT